MFCTQTLKILRMISSRCIRKKPSQWDNAHMEHSCRHTPSFTCCLLSWDPQRPLQALQDCTKKPNWLPIIEQFLGLKPIIPDPTNSNSVILQVGTGLNFSLIQCGEKDPLSSFFFFFCFSIIKYNWQIRQLIFSLVVKAFCLKSHSQITSRHLRSTPSFTINIWRNVVLDECCPIELLVIMEMFCTSPICAVQYDSL